MKILLKGKKMQFSICRPARHTPTCGLAYLLQDDELVHALVFGIKELQSVRLPCESMDPLLARLWHRKDGFDINVH